jgi:hypothetical protein
MSILNVNTIQPVGSGQTITVSAANISASSTVVTASSFVGNVTGTVNSTGIITATSFSGSGSGLTGIVNSGITTVAAGSTSAPSISPTGDSNTGIFFPSADTIAFAEGGAEAVRFNSSGELLVGTTSSTANGGKLQISNGITFPATAVACTDVNTLDDYEEGTWTPSVGGTATYTVQTGTYTKVGRLVHVSVMLTINTIGTGSATQINSLPFTISGTNNDIGAFPGYVSNAANSYVSLGFDCYTNSINIYARTAASTSSGSSGFFGNGTALRMQMVYHTN